MPNWFYLLVSLVYHLGLALWIGGILVLGAVVAPSLFRSLDRPVAGAIFGTIFRRFTRVRIAGLLMTLAAALTRHLLWETHASSTRYGTWIFLRWAALAVMAVTVAHDLLLEGRMDVLRGQLASDEALRPQFDRLHRRSEAMARVALLAAVVVAFFS